MCIFSQPIVSVSTTQIFARQTSLDSQYLVYQMKYETDHSNAMILPIPVSQPANDHSLRFIDFENYAEFFDDLRVGFPFKPSVSFGCSAPLDSKSIPDLKVHKIGNYIASFVPNLNDFARLDDRFTLPRQTWAQIPEYERFGFAVFQLEPGAGKPHPMAFEYRSDNKSIYFPTLHIHDGQVHETEEFDHVLYLQHAGIDSRVSGYENGDVADGTTGLVRSKYTAREFCNVHATNGVVDGDLLIHRREIHGHHPNLDTLFATTGHPTIRTFNFRSWRPFAPWLFVGGVLTWFFTRRNRLKRQKHLDSDQHPK